ncbi:MAG: hypothetical protein J7496_10140, partial [Novosphingobium sp.]|nr:hypothetical protein [Novosphingobium sp.]
VNYATSNGTATAGSDYTAKSGTLTFTAAQTSKTITVSTTQDTTSEANETLNVTLSSPTSPATIADATGVGTIVDDDGWSATLTAGEYECALRCTDDGYIAGTTGSMTNTSYGSYQITGVYVETVSHSVEIILSMSGSAVPPNSGWTSIIIPGVGTFTRTSANYSSVGTTARWDWVGAIGDDVTNGTVTIQ